MINVLTYQIEKKIVNESLFEIDCLYIIDETILIGKNKQMQIEQFNKLCEYK